MLNLPLMKNPVNWVIILLMVIIGTVGLHFLVTWIYPSKSETE